MKNLMSKIYIVLILSSIIVYGQSNIDAINWMNNCIEGQHYGFLDDKEYKHDLKSFDYSSLFLRTPAYHIYGVIGDNMQRLRMKIISMNKDPQNPENYYVYGKSKVKNNICEFTGIIKIRSIRLYKTGKYDMPSRSKINPEKIGILFCDYTFIENQEETHTGIFNGISSTAFYINNDTLKYNDLGYFADDMTNNEFVGIWTSHKNRKSLLCNWGDYRVPNVSGFDCGAASFAPCAKYLPYGWSDHYDNVVKDDPEAKKRERIEWWR